MWGAGGPRATSLDPRPDTLRGELLVGSGAAGSRPQNAWKRTSVFDLRGTIRGYDGGDPKSGSEAETRTMAHTIIGNTIVIDGEVIGDEDLIVRGTIRGRVHLSESIVVEQDGVLEANVETATITIYGTVTGDVHATKRAELERDCRVAGDVRAPRVLIADGASFKGNVDMEG